MVIMFNERFQSFSAELEAFVWPDEDKKQRVKRQRILLAATNLFIQMGYRKTSIDAIARQAAIAKGTIYLYYNNKAEVLFHAIALEKLTHVTQLVQHIKDDLTAEDVLRTFIVIAVVMSRKMPLTASLLRGDQEISLALEEVDEKLRLAIGQMRVDAVRDLLDETTHKKLSRKQLNVLSQTLVELLNSIFLSKQAFGPDFPLIKYAQTLADMLIDGLLQTKLQKPSAALKPLYKELSRQTL